MNKAKKQSSKRKRFNPLLKNNEEKPAITIELGEFVPSNSSTFTQIKKQCKGIIDIGILAPYIVKTQEVGELMGLAFPSVDPKGDILVGLVTVKASNLTRKSVTLIHRATEASVRKAIAAKFKTELEAGTLTRSFISHMLTPYGFAAR
ncbi:MAG TPA: hypothetical protein V6D33_12010 [Cyanophyceae cyanobacterium]